MNCARRSSASSRPLHEDRRTINEPGAMLARVIGAYAAKEDA
jgi:hypothetical protein